MLMPKSCGPKKSVCVRWMFVRWTANRTLLTTVLLRTIVSPIASDCAELSRPPRVVARILPVFAYAGSQNVVVSM